MGIDDPRLLSEIKARELLARAGFEELQQLKMIQAVAQSSPPPQVTVPLALPCVRHELHSDCSCRLTCYSSCRAYMYCIVGVSCRGITPVFLPNISGVELWIEIRPRRFALCCHCADATSGAACACRDTILWHDRLKMLEKVDTLVRVRYVSASAGGVLRRERKRKALARGTWAGGSIDCDRLLQAQGRLFLEIN